MRFFTSILLIVFLSTNTFSFVFAGTESSLDRDIQSSERVLDTLVDRVDTTLERADTRIKDPEQSARIEEKQKEIEVLLEDTKEELADADTKGEIKEIVAETKKLIDLKVEAATTPTADVLDTISQTVQIQQKDIPQAQETLRDSFATQDGYVILLRTRKNPSDLDIFLRKYDAEFTLTLLFEEGGLSQYELVLPQGSLIQKELFENIDSGEIPKDLFGIEVIQPELFQISDIAGESSDKLWGMNRYGVEKWVSSVSTQTTKNGKKVTIGIVDTGISPLHSDLSSQISRSTLGYDFVNDDNDPTDDQGHGTHVSGTIAGSINGSGVYGVNPSVELVGLKICDSKGFCPSYAVINALKYARDHDIDILNMSLGAKGNPTTSPICQAIADITDHGGIVVAAAGNSNVDTSTFVPGGCATAITVGAVDSGLNRASFSNYGSKVDVAAPGVGIYSSYLASGYKSMNGTSMATPHIVGIVSLLETYRADISVTDIKKLFSQYTIPVNTDSQKPIGYFTDLNALMLSITQGSISENKKPSTEDVKPPVNTRATLSNTGTLQKPIHPTPPVQTGTLDHPSADIATIDESIGLMIQEKLSGVEINSALDTSASLIITGASDTVQINSADEENEGASSTLLEGLPTTNILSSSEGVQINSADDESTPNGESIDFDNLDRTHSPVISTAEGGVEINSTDDEREEILIDPEWAAPTPEGVQINSSDDEEQFIELPVISESVALSQKIQKKTTGEEGVEINSALYCTVYIGGSCGYNLNNALGYTYSTSMAGGVQISIGSNGFTVYGKLPGTAMVFILSRGSIVHTVSVTVQSPPRTLSYQIGANTLNPGYSTWFQITDGNGGYSVTSSNPNVIWVSGAGTNYTLSAKSSGTATITYRDQRGYYGSIIITVTAPARAIQANISGWSAEVAKTITLTVTDGNGGYTATSSNPSIATVSSASSSVFTIMGKSLGSARITVRDSRGQYNYVDITITPPARTLKYTYGVTSLNIGSSSRLSITDGNGGYVVTSSNPAIIAVSGSNTEWSLIAKSAGAVTITVRDARGYYSQITYTVIAPLRSLRAMIGSTLLSRGESTIFTITDGNGGYVVTSSNPAILSATRTNPASDTQWTLTALSPGESLVTVRDSRGFNGSIKITVKAKDLILSTYALTVEVGSDAYFRVNSGNGGYAHAMSNGNVGWYYDNSSIPSYRVRGVTPGTTILQIRDSAGKIGQVVVTVKQKIKDLVVTGFGTSRSGIIGDSIVFTTTSGNGGYTITSSNPSIVTASIHNITGNGRIDLRSSGVTTILIQDNQGKSVKMDITVTTGVTLNILNQNQDISNSKIGGINFQLSGRNLANVTTVGIQLTNSQGRIEKIPLKIQSDGEYIVGFADIRCKGCTNFRPYYSIGGGNSIASADPTDDDSSNEYGPEKDSGVEISSYGSEEFYSILSMLWYTGGWHSSYVATEKKLVDFRDNVLYNLPEITAELGKASYQFAKTAVVSTYQDGKTCIMKGGVQECLSTCGISLDYGVVTAPVAMVCDAANGIIYVFQGEYITAGAQALAIIPYAGTIIKGGSKGLKLTKEAEQSVAEQITKKAADDAAKLTKITLVLSKGIKSIDMSHINMRHAYGSAPLDASKYLQGTNIEAVIKEGYAKSNKKFMETMSGTRPSIEIEVDMGKKIGTNSNGNGDYTILRMVMDYDGNIISAYPVANFKSYNQ